MRARRANGASWTRLPLAATIKNALFSRILRTPRTREAASALGSRFHRVSKDAVTRASSRRKHGFQVLASARRLAWLGQGWHSLRRGFAPARAERTPRTMRSFARARLRRPRETLMEPRFPQR